MLRQRFNEALKEAVRARDKRAMSTIRLILAALKDRDIAERSRGNTDGIDEQQIYAMLSTMVKQRREAREAYEQGGRLELAEQEAEEIAIIESFLPKQLDDSEMEEAINRAIADVGATGIRDMGQTMAELKRRHSGQMDFSRASEKVKRRLAGA